MKLAAAAAPMQLRGFPRNDFAAAVAGDIYLPALCDNTNAV